MKKIFIILLISYSILNINCEPAKKDFYGLNKLKGFFPDSLVDHFSYVNLNKIQEFRFIYPEGSFIAKSSNIMLQCELSEYEFNKTLNYLMNNSISIIDPNNEDLFIINRFLMFENEKTNSILNSLNYLDIKYEHPIPNFSIIKQTHLDTTFSDSIIRLPKDYQLFLISAGRKNIINRNIPSSYGVPSEWEHGFSKGVALNKKKKNAVFWLTAW